MEVEDPISTKFQALIESLMAKATSDIVKVFAEVLLETRVEISRSWKEIDELKQKLEESEEQKAEAVSRSQAILNFKLETEEVLVSHVSPQITFSDNDTVSPVGQRRKGVILIHSDVRVENGDSIQYSVEVPEPTTSSTTTDTSAINPSINGPNETQEAQIAETVVKRKRGRPPKSSRVTQLQKPAPKTESSSKFSLQGVSVVDTQQPSSSTDIIILGKKTSKKGTVVKRKKYIQKKFASVSSVGPTHTLRDRQLLTHHKPCLCCPSDQFSLQEKQPKIGPRVVSQVYTCRKCRNKFNEWLQYKEHKCSIVRECNRCGNKFTNLRNLTRHKQSIQPSTRPFPYCCFLCGHMFATQCGWNLHKRIHAHSNLTQSDQKGTSQFSQPSTLPKELKAKLEVRLERISDAQLEAALCPKSLSGQNPTLSFTTTSAGEKPASRVYDHVPSAGIVLNNAVLSKESGSQTKQVLVLKSGSGIAENVKQLDGSTQTASGQIQPSEKSTYSKSLTVPTADSVENEAGSLGGSEESTKGLNSLSRKRKMSDCSHDVYNGVFPVEKILRWRNTKGRNEVRVKWMPCSLCGAKWKNTWEPAESFTSYMDSNSEEPESSQN